MPATFSLFLTTMYVPFFVPSRLAILRCKTSRLPFSQKLSVRVVDVDFAPQLQQCTGTQQQHLRRHVSSTARESTGLTSCTGTRVPARAPHSLRGRPRRGRRPRPAARAPRPAVTVMAPHKHVVVVLVFMRLVADSVVLQHSTMPQRRQSMIRSFFSRSTYMVVVF